MAVAWIDDLHVNLEADGAKRDAGHTCGFAPLEERAGGKSKALMAARAIDGVRRDANRFIAVCIVLGNDSNISRQTDAGVDGAPSQVLHTKSERRLLTNDHDGRDHDRHGKSFPELGKNSTGLLRPRRTARTTDCERCQCKGSNRLHRHLSAQRLASAAARSRSCALSAACQTSGSRSGRHSFEVAANAGRVGPTRSLTSHSAGGS